MIFYSLINFMKKTIILLLSLISVLVLLVRFSPNILELVFGIKPKSGLSILSQPTEATVFIDGEEVGKTPYESKDLVVKQYIIKLEKDQALWQGKVSLNSGALTVINRDLAEEIASSSGEILSLEKGRGITVVSNPNNAEVEIDGNYFGKTPLSVNIDSGVHTVAVSHPSFLSRSIRAILPEDYNLVVLVDLALSEADLTAVTTPVIYETQQLVAKDTPTGFLRVRDKPSLNGKEIGRVKPKDTLILLEEAGEWMRIRTGEGLEGYVSAIYVEKIQSLQ